MVIPEWFYATSIFTAFGAGFALGKYFAPKPKTVTTNKSYCTVPIQRGKRFKTAITMIHVNGKLSDITCSYLIAGGICELSGTRCKYLL